jgi:hypothetical protein
MGSTELLAMLLPIGLFLMVFILLREFWCWYWKVNQILELQQQIVSLLAQQANREIKG